MIAHRGSSAHAPENTLLAARLGHEAGAEAWEFDVHLTRDGVPVVIHDESLLRTTDVADKFAGDPRAGDGYAVADFDWAEIRTLDAGSWFLAPAGYRSAAAFGTRESLALETREQVASGTVGVPTLVDALKLTRRLDWLANVELKTFPNADPALLDAVLAAVEQTETASRILLSSFEHDDVARAVRLRPDIATGVLAATPIHRPADYVRTVIGADAYHPSDLVLGAGTHRYRRSRGVAGLRHADLEALGAARVPVLVYTVNDDTPGALATHLAGAGVAGLFTDFPDRLRRLFALPNRH